MKTLNDKTVGGSSPQKDFLNTDCNEIASELQNLYEVFGITPSSSDLNQVGKGIANYVSNGNYYTDTGSANAYVLAEIGSKQLPTAYADGMLVCFIAGATNTVTNPTLAIGTLPAKTMKQSNNGAIPVGILPTGHPNCWRYRASDDSFILAQPLMTNDSAEFMGNRVVADTFRAEGDRGRIELADTNEGLPDAKFNIDASNNALSVHYIIGSDYDLSSEWRKSARFSYDGGAALYYQNAGKFLTQADGIQVYGNANCDTSPSSAAHLTRKDYVDGAINSATTLSSGLNGYWKDNSSGLIVQWGKVDVSNAGGGDADGSTNYPIAFPTTALVVVGSYKSNASNPLTIYPVTSASYKKTKFEWDTQNTYDDFYWIAIGY